MQLSDRLLSHLTRAGAKLCWGSRAVPRLAIVDGLTVVLSRNQIDYGEGALITEGAALASMLTQSLTAEQGDSDAVDGEQLDPLSLEVLHQLGTGAKDESAARDMGLAVRTYRRLVASVLERLNARSRFQAGALAARRGWL